jgi:hypothetical protein
MRVFFAFTVVSLALAGCGSAPALGPLAASPIPVLADPSLVPLPYAEVEAESGLSTGSFPAADTSLHSAGAEASGRRYVELPPGAILVLPVPRDSDSLVVRYSWPDGVADGTLVGSVEERPVGTLAVTGRYAWVYGTGGGWGTNDVWRQTTGEPRHFWDEASTATAPMAAGSDLTLANPVGSKATVLIDLVDFELRAPAVAAPAGSLSFADWAPDATGATDVTDKLQKALDKAKGKVLYIPEGVYQIADVYLPAVTVQGAGLWRTKFVGAGSQFRFQGKTASLADLAVFGETNTRDDTSDEGNGLAGTPGPQSSVTRVWVEHKKCAFWVGPWGGKVTVTGLTLTDCRFRNLMADGVNLCSGTNNTIVRGCLVRNSGDDGLAAWSPKSGGPADGGNLFEGNLVQSPWLASAIALYGGGPVTVRGNEVKDTVTTGSGVYVSANFASWPFSGLVDVTGNLLIRVGAHESDAGGPTGAMRLLAFDGDMTGGRFVFTDNTIVDPVESAVSIQGPRNLGKVNLDGLVVRGLSPGAPVVDVKSNASGGEVTLTRVVVEGAPEAQKAFPGGKATLRF